MAQKSKKVPLKQRLLEEGWFDTEKEAASWAMLRRILVDDQLIASISQRVSPNGVIRIKEYYKRRYVNKGGLKLEKALADFNLSVENLPALDCGASTGGFTDCLLQRGASLVYAVDAGHGQLAGKLQIDPRTVNLENTNISCESLLRLDPTPHFITLDLSYLSLKKAVPAALAIMKNEGVLVCLIKPIFETESSEIRRTGNINNPELHEEILPDLIHFFKELGLSITGLIHSPIRGNNDAIEYLIALSTEINQDKSGEVQNQLKQIIEDAFTLDKFNKKGGSPCP